MKTNNITAVYFSPTGGTKKYVCGLAEKLSPDYKEIDLTNPEIRKKDFIFEKDDLIIFGAPVYAGRIPQVEGLFKNIHGSQTPAVFVVSYGNRDYDDALLELRDVCEAEGFIGIAGASVIAPHTYSDKAGAGRPDAKDFNFIDKLASDIQEKIEKAANFEKELKVKGHFPYKEWKAMPFYAKADNKCIGCGVCVGVCPVSAIPKTEPNLTDKKKCILCFACVKKCPVKARKANTILFKIAIKLLEKKLTQGHKQPEAFL